MINRIGIKITHERPEHLPRAEGSLKYCQFIGRARSGERFYTENEDISCPLARYNLGLEQLNYACKNALARTLVGWDDADSIEIGLEYLQTRILLPHSEKYILYFPYPDSEYEPDVIIEFSTPLDIMNKVKSHTKETGIPIDSYISGIGALCGECTAFPLQTGKPNVSLGCSGSRPGIKLRDNELILAVPVKDCKYFSFFSEFGKSHL